MDEKASQAARAELQKAQAVLELDPRGARRHLAEARHLDPRDPDIALELARLELRLSRYRDALENLDRVLRLDENRTEALALSCLCQWKLGRSEQAEAMAEMALGLDPNNRVALEVRADCHRISKLWQEAARGYQNVLAITGVFGTQARARLELKLARCLLEQGAHVAAWELAEGLRGRGHGGAAVRALRRDCERRNRRDVSQSDGKVGLWERLQWRLAQRQISRALFLGQRRGRQEVPQKERGDGGIPVSVPPVEPKVGSV
ncbi:MAG: tetratricopeptide repeat protein [bacterium]